MAISVVGSAAVTAKQYTTNATINLPADIAAGDGLVVVVFGTMTSLSASGWTVDGGVCGATSQYMYVMSKEASGSEGTTLGLTYGGTQYVQSVAVRLSGASVADIVSQFVNGVEASAEDPFTLAGGTLTGATAGNWALVCFGTDSGDRTVVTPDANCTLVGSTTGGAGGTGALHVYYETLAGTENSAYSFDMNDTRAYRWGLFEITASGAATITETLIDLNGDPVASETGLTVLVWYAEPTGAPDEEHTSVTTDASGNLSVALTGTPLEGDPVWIVVYKDGTPYKMTAVKTAVVYA